MQVIIITSFVLYAFILLRLLFFTSRGYWSNMPLFEYAKYSSNIIPLKTIVGYISALSDGRMNTDIPIRNLVGNILAFMPMGFYLPFICSKLSKGKVYICIVVAIIFAVEVLQLLTRRGVFDVDDIILNNIGALIGFAICSCTPIRGLFKYRLDRKVD